MEIIFQYSMPKDKTSEHNFLHNYSGKKIISFEKNESDEIQSYRVIFEDLKIESVFEDELTIHLNNGLKIPFHHNEAFFNKYLQTTEEVCEINGINPEEIKNYGYSYMNALWFNSEMDITEYPYNFNKLFIEIDNILFKVVNSNTTKVYFEGVEMGNIQYSIQQIFEMSEYDMYSIFQKRYFI